jgi:hypothetical protein
MRTTGRMLNNANVVGFPDGTWYEPKRTAVRPYRVIAAPKQLGCCGMGGLGTEAVGSSIFSIVVPVALGAGLLVLISSLAGK